MKKAIISLIFGLLCLQAASAQTFADKCLGSWKGTMYMYGQGILRDSVNVKLTVAKTADPNAWTWKTEYLSATLPQVKDYILRFKDKNMYVTDEGGGIELNNYVFENKMYNIFEVEGITLTATYELREKELIFEVTSGKKITAPNQAITNFSVSNLQRVVFKKVE